MDKTYIYHGAKIVFQLPNDKLDKGVNKMFTLDNTQGFTKKGIEELNNRLNALLENRFSPNPDGDYSENDVKNAMDQVSNSWTDYDSEKFQ